MKTRIRQFTTVFCGSLLSEDALTYGAALLAAASAGIVGIGSPGLEGVLMNLLLCLLIMKSGGKESLWKLCLCLLVLQFVMIAPKRLVSIGIRGLSGMSFHLETVANMVATFWMVIGVASVIRRLFHHSREVRSASSLATNNIK